MKEQNSIHVNHLSGNRSIFFQIGQHTKMCVFCKTSSCNWAIQLNIPDVKQVSRAHCETPLSRRQSLCEWICMEGLPYWVDKYPKGILRISRQLEIDVSSLYVSIPLPMSSATSLTHEELRHNAFVCRLSWKGMPFYYDVAIWYFQNNPEIKSISKST